MADRNFKVRALGEIAIRCANKDRMVDFYRNVIGLTLLSGGDSERVTFFELGESHGGHTAVLALFRSDAEAVGISATSAPPPMTGERSSLHHLALSLPYDEQQAVMDWYDSLSQSYRVEHFRWIGWRGIFTEDPEGNTVELVARDPSFVQ